MTNLCVYIYYICIYIYMYMFCGIGWALSLIIKLLRSSEQHRCEKVILLYEPASRVRKWNYPTVSFQICFVEILYVPSFWMSTINMGKTNNMLKSTHACGGSFHLNLCCFQQGIQIYQLVLVFLICRHSEHSVH